jgi:exonuclease III
MDQTFGAKAKKEMQKIREEVREELKRVSKQRDEDILVMQDTSNKVNDFKEIRDNNNEYKGVIVPLPNYRIKSQIQ